MISAPVTPWLTPTLIPIQAAVSGEIAVYTGSLGWIVIILGMAAAARIIYTFIERSQSIE